MATMVERPWEAHGPLRVSANGRYLEHADGHGFFVLADTPWHLPALPPADVERYLAHRAGRGFNLILVDTTMVTRPNYRGDLPFAGTGPPWPATTLNEPFWAHIDRIVETARRHGLSICFLLWRGFGAGNSHRPADPTHRQYYDDPNTENYRLRLPQLPRDGGGPRLHAAHPAEGERGAAAAAGAS
jgi:hypothetical protein